VSSIAGSVLMPPNRCRHVPSPPQAASTDLPRPENRRRKFSKRLTGELERRE
jgi:hypothetical protein